MERHQFYRKFQHLNLDERQLERKYIAYLTEQEEMQRMYEAVINAQRSQSSTAGGGSASSLSGSFQCVVDTTNNLEFRIGFISTNEPIEFTIDWGDGNIHEDSGYGGFYEEYHTYDEAGEYTVNVSFNKPLNVLQLDFQGSDEGYSNIISITGLQNLKNLEEFRADWNSLTSVDFSGMTNLTFIDISDCETISSNEPSLSSVNLTGCINLEELRLDDSNFSISIPDFRDLQNLNWLDIDDSSLSGLIDVSFLPNLEQCDLSQNSAITAVTISRNQPIGRNESSLDLSECGLSREAIDFILVELSLNGVTDGFVNLSGEGNAVPGEEGLAAKEVLEGNGWNVEVNLPPPGSVSILASTDFDIVDDFTIEMFVNFSNLSGNIRPYSFGAYPSAANAISFESGTMYFWANSNYRSTGTFNPTTEQWYHICVMRSGAVGDKAISLFVDGVRIGTFLYNDPIPSQSLPLTIGNGNEPGSSLNGLISNFRWTSSAVYDDSGFTVPTSPLTDLPDTKLLIFQGTDLNAILTDNSGNGHNATGTGSFAYSSDDPFNSAQGSLQVGTV